MEERNSEFELEKSIRHFANLEGIHENNLEQLLLPKNNNKNIDKSHDDSLSEQIFKSKGKKSNKSDLDNYLKRQSKILDLDDILMLESNFYKQVKKTSNTNNSNNVNVIQNTNSKKITDSNSENDNLTEDSFLDEFTGSKNFTEIKLNSVIMTITQIINCIIKSSLVQIAYCMKTLGMLYGSITIIIVAYFSLISLKLLMRVHERTKIKSYLLFSDVIFGKFGKFILLTLNFGSAYGNCLTFVKIFFKVIPNIITITLGNKQLNNTFALQLIMGIILFYYCFKKDISGIKKAAYYGFLGIIFFFIFTITDFFYTIRTGENIEKLQELKIKEIIYGMDKNLYSKLNALACIILSFSFHIFTFSIYGCMGQITITEFYVTAAGSIFICATIYLLCGTIGFLLYFNEIKDSILDASGKKILNTCLSLANCLSVIMTFPITFAALKNYWILLIEVFLTKFRDFIYFIFGCCKCVKMKKRVLKDLKVIEVNNFFGNATSVMLPKFVEIIVVIILFISVFYISTLDFEFKFIFGILGGLMGNTLSFIFPALFYLKIQNKESWHSKNNIISVLFVFLGTLSMICCITSTLIEKFGSKK